MTSTNDAGTSDAGAGVMDGGSDAGRVDAGSDAGKVNVCSAAAGTVAWTASIPAATTSLVPMRIVAGSTNDVVVSDINNASTFQQYRWDSSGVLSVATRMQKARTQVRCSRATWSSMSRTTSSMDWS